MRLCPPFPTRGSVPLSVDAYKNHMPTIFEISFNSTFETSTRMAPRKPNLAKKPTSTPKAKGKVDEQNSQELIIDEDFNPGQEESEGEETDMEEEEEMESDLEEYLEEEAVSSTNEQN